MAENLDKGTFGEQGAGFFLGPQGYFFVEGPSGTQGHAANASGFDGVAYNIALDHLIIYDNKAFASSRNVGKGTAIDPAVNLTQNLDGLIGRVQNMTDMPSRYRILYLLRQTRVTVSSTGVSPPPNVRIAITNFGGNSRGITNGLAGRGITFIDMNAAPAVPTGSSKIYLNKENIQSMAQPVASTDGADSYNTRRGRVDAFAEGARAIAQTANDYALQSAINRAWDDLWEQVVEILLQGNGALVVMVVHTSTFPGNVGMINARSVTSSFVRSYLTSSKQDAISRWQLEPQLTWNGGANDTCEQLLFWVPVPDVR